MKESFLSYVFAWAGHRQLAEAVRTVVWFAVGRPTDATRAPARRRCR
jgi:hypothetical protein